MRAPVDLDELYAAKPYANWVRFQADCKGIGVSLQCRPIIGCRVYGGVMSVRCFTSVSRVWDCHLCDRGPVDISVSSRS